MDSMIETQANISSIKITSSVSSFDVVKDKTFLFVSCNIHTSLFNHLMRMTLILNDQNDIVKNMKLVGNEEITITFTKYNEKFKTLKFRVNSIVNDGIKNTNEKKGNIILDCVSEEYLTGSYSICKRLRGTADSIVSSIVSNNLASSKILSSDTFSYQHDYQTNYKNSFDVINYFEKNSDSFFFEDFDGFNFKKFESLGLTSINETINFYVNQKQFINDNVPRAYKLENFNNEILLGKGTINSTYYNIENNRYLLNKTTLKNSESITTNFGNTAFFTQLENKKSNVECVYGRINKRLSRLMQLYNLQSHTISIKTNANINRRIGQKVSINFQGHDNSQVNHPFYYGSWVIVAIKNELVPGSFTQDVQFAKLKLEK